MLCDREVVINPGNPWSFCAYPSRSVVFSLSMWLGKDLYYSNAMRLEPPGDVIKIFQPMKLTTPFPSTKIGGWFQYYFGERGWYKSENSTKLHQYSYKGQKLMHLKFHHNFLNFELIRNISVEYRTLRVIGPICLPSYFVKSPYYEVKATFRCVGAMVGPDAVEVEWDLIGEVTKRQRVLCKLKVSFFHFQSALMCIENLFLKNLLEKK